MPARSRSALERNADTRTRLMESAMRLFAAHGYAGTTVGDIEREAGLAPRSGALYQYFGGKEELLHAALERELAALEELGAVIDTLPGGDLRSALTMLARWNLTSLSRRESLNRFLARDADRLPAPLRKKAYEGLVERPYDQIVQLLKAVLPAERTGFDAEALALVFIQAMAGYRSMATTFGKVAGGVDDERFVRTWVDVALAVARDAGVE